MPDHPVARHGLEEFLRARSAVSDSNSQIVVEVMSGIGYLNLRGNSDDHSFVADAEKVIGQALPDSAHTMTVGDHACYWLGPDEWLLATDHHRANKLADALRDAFATGAGSVSSLSGGYVKFVLSGAAWHRVLAKGCTLDLAQFREQQNVCVQCGLGKATVLIAGTENGQAVEIIVRRSFAEYVALWLEKSGSGIGIRFGTFQSSFADHRASSQS